ncbi:flagellar assembly protein FliH [Gammaproteobacteria bacterium]
MSRVIAKEELDTTLRRWKPPVMDDSFWPSSQVPEPQPAFVPATALPLSQPQSIIQPGRKKETVARPDPAAKLPTVDAIETISREAYAEGFERGRQEGITKGIEEGYREGLIKGHEEGFKQGIEEGTTTGIKQGIEQGMEQGIEQGQRDGLAQGIEEGRRTGLDQGFKDGKRDGLAQGIEEGRRDGLAQGIEEGRRDGLAQGVEEGRRDGLAKGDAEVQAKLNQLGQFLTLLDQPLANLDSEVEEQLVALVVAVARQIVRRELRIGAGEIIPVVREALASLPTARRNLRIFLHPDDVPLVRVALGKKEGTNEIRIEEDATITRGGCRVETDTSQIDATVEHRINRVVARLLGKEDSQEFFDPAGSRGF